MSVMTSLYPNVHRVQTYQNKLSGEITTLAEVLKAAGYTTLGVISNPTIEGRYGFSDGFDLYDDFTVSLDFGMDMFGNNDKIIGDRHLSRSSELVTKTAVQWLQGRLAEPFFMFTFYFDPHYDYIPPAPFDTMFDPNYEGRIDGRGMNNEPRRSTRPSDRDLQHLLALYDGEIRYTDGYVAQLLEAMAASGLLENTLVVLFGDHGDEFYEHGKTTHARTLYDEIVHVPLILRWPGRLPAGKRIDAITSLVDIMPTILDCLGLPYEGPMQGISLRPLIDGKMERSRDTVWAELNNGIAHSGGHLRRSEASASVRDRCMGVLRSAERSGRTDRICTIAFGRGGPVGLDSRMGAMGPGQPAAFRSSGEGKGCRDDRSERAAACRSSRPLDMCSDGRHVIAAGIPLDLAGILCMDPWWWMQTPSSGAGNREPATAAACS